MVRGLVRERREERGGAGLAIARAEMEANAQLAGCWEAVEKGLALSRSRVGCAVMPRKSTLFGAFGHGKKGRVWVGEAFWGKWLGGRDFGWRNSLSGGNFGEGREGRPGCYGLEAIVAKVVVKCHAELTNGDDKIFDLKLAFR